MHLPDVRMLSTSKGKPSGGAFSFIRSIRSTLYEFKGVDRVIVVFDQGRSERRKALYPEYKANRKVNDEVDPDGLTYIEKFNTQIRILRYVLPKLGAKIVQLPGREGDDLMALIPRLLGSALTIIATDDRDLLQLVSPTVHVWRPIAQQLVTLDSFEEYAKSKREFFLLYKAIIGDKSDNIIGVKGVGPKTANKFLDECPCIGEYPFDEFFEYLIEVDTKKADDVLDNSEQVTLNYEILDLGREEFHSNEEAKVLAGCTTPTEVDALKVKKAFVALEYFSLVDDFAKWIVRFQMLR